MRTSIITSQNNFLKGLFMVIVVLLQIGCTKTPKTDNTQTSSALDVPALFERKGDLAKATEWQKTKEKVEELKQKLSKDPNDIKTRLQVATIYLSEARITGEHPYYYPAILKILDGILYLNPNNFEAITYKASVKMSQHQFAEARDLAEKARKLNADNAYIYGVLVDANVELGFYKEAIEMSEKMQALKPSLEAYSRASYLREIYGDYKGSIIAMQMAVEAGLPGSEPYCWSKNTLGHLYESTGQLKLAERQYAEILAIRPSYAFAYRGQARILKANKKYDEALAVLEKAVTIMPEFSFHEEMAEIYALQGQQEKAQKKYAEVVTMLDEDAKSGHAVDLELCKLYTKAGQLQQALNFGLKEYRKRPNNIDVNHAMAVIAYEMNDLKKAKAYLTVALSTGSKNPELLADASKIEKNIAMQVTPQAVSELIAKAIR
jgi:tetratricopeptide (TPR) repeat protein